MARYRISEHAGQDLFAIAKYGDERFGLAASDAYRDKLINCFEAVAETPLRYSAVVHIREGYRRSVCGVNSIYFRVVDDGVEIMRVLGHQDVATAFEER